MSNLNKYLQCVAQKPVKSLLEMHSLVFLEPHIEFCVSGVQSACYPVQYEAIFKLMWSLRAALSRMLPFCTSATRWTFGYSDLSFIHLHLTQCFAVIQTISRLFFNFVLLGVFPFYSFYPSCELKLILLRWKLQIQSNMWK